MPRNITSKGPVKGALSTYSGFRFQEAFQNHIVKSHTHTYTRYVAKSGDKPAFHEVHYG